MTCSEQSEDKLTAILKKDESDILDTSTEETVFPKECHICKEVFKDIKSFSKHVKTHNTKTKSRRSKQEVWPCCVCGRKLTSAVRQACHHYSKHGIPYDESLRLHACDIEVSTESLRLHVCDIEVNSTCDIEVSTKSLRLHASDIEVLKA